jgi:hypothetical protein
MKIQYKAISIFILIFSLLLSGCAPGQIFGATVTPTPSITTTPTLTPIPTETPTLPPTLTPTPVIKTFNITIPANVEWFNTGINLTIGQNMIISSSGKVNTNGGRSNGNTLSPDGQTNNPLCYAFNSANCLMSEVFWGTLVGKIENGDPFKVGSQLQISVSSSGNLYLAVNDNEGFFNDNSGSFDSTIVVVE